MSQKPKSHFKKGDSVEWKWLGRPIRGVVKEVFLAPVERVIKGKKIKRNGSPAKPAYLVESEAGNLALKLQTELTPASSGAKSWRGKRPTLFDN